MFSSEKHALNVLKTCVMLHPKSVTVYSNNKPCREMSTVVEGDLVKGDYKEKLERKQALKISQSRGRASNL